MVFVYLQWVLAHTQCGLGGFVYLQWVLAEMVAFLLQPSCLLFVNFHWLLFLLNAPFAAWTIFRYGLFTHTHPDTHTHTHPHRHTHRHTHTAWTTYRYGLSTHAPRHTHTQTHTHNLDHLQVWSLSIHKHPHTYHTHTYTHSMDHLQVWTLSVHKHPHTYHTTHTHTAWTIYRYGSSVYTNTHIHITHTHTVATQCWAQCPQCQISWPRVVFNR